MASSNDRIELRIAKSNNQYSTFANTGDVIIYTRQNNKLILQSGIQSGGLVISGSNNVGIGKSSPSYTLDVSGNTAISDTLLVSKRFIAGNNIFTVNQTQNIVAINNNLLYADAGSNRIALSGLPDPSYNNTLRNNTLIENFTTPNNINASSITLSAGIPIVISSNTKINNLNADLLDGLDSTKFMRTDANTGTTGILTANRFISLIPTGTEPLTVSSSTKVSNLNVDLFDNQDSSFYRNVSNINAGTLIVPYGGIGTQVLTPNSLLVGNGTNLVLSPDELTWNNNHLDVSGNLSVGNTIYTTNIDFSGNLFQNGSLYISSQWTDTSNNNLFYNNYVGIGTNFPTEQLDVSGTIQLSGHFLPNTNITSDLGSSDKRFRDLYLSGSTIDISGALIKYDPVTKGLRLTNYANTTVGATFMDVFTDGNVTVGGNLTVNGDVITLETSTVIVEDPVITLGGALILNSNDGKNRGIEFKYYDGSSKIGFFGYENNTGNLVYLLDASNNGEVFSGIYGSIKANTFIGDTLNVTSTGLVSNLNADLLDGQQGSYYNNWDNLFNKPNLVNSFNSRIGDISLNATDISAALTYVPLDASTYTALDVLNKLIMVDGSGSQLDADYLDGFDGSFYRDMDNINAGILPVIHGGTGNHSLNSNRLLVGNGTNSILSPTDLVWDGIQVGIGTLSPSQVLDVSGNINFSGYLYQNGSPYIGSQWVDGSYNALYYNTGNVGIGTSNPSQTLDISGTMIVNNLIVRDEWMIANDTPYIRTQLQIQGIQRTFIITDASQNTFDISMNGRYYLESPNQVHVFIDGVKLGYYSNSNNDYHVSINNQTSITYFTIVLTEPAIQGNVIDLIVYPRFLTNEATKEPGYVYQVINSPWDISNNIVYYTGGNVGIGTLTPSQVLDVSGNINFSGYLYQNGSPYIGSQWVDSSNNALYYNVGHVGIGTMHPTQTLDISGDMIVNNFTVREEWFIAEDTSFNRTQLQVHPIIRTIKISSNGQYIFDVSMNGQFAINSPKDVCVYVDGVKLAYIDSNYNDYNVITNLYTTYTEFIITLNRVVNTNNIVDIVVYPKFVSENATKEPGYIYQVLNSPWDISNNNVFYIGNVGIGTDSPSKNLDISGDVIISGSLTANNIIGNTSTATQLGTPRKIALQGDVSGNVFFDGSSDVTINSTIQPNSVELGTDTFGNYIATITSGADISVSGSGTESAAVTLSNTSTLQSVTDRGSTTTNHITAPQFVSSTTTLAPFNINSTSKVTNLNADLLDGLDGSYYLDSSHINTGTLSVSYGGIGTQTLTPNKLLVGNGSNLIISPVELTWNNQLDVSANIQLSGHLLPASNITSDLGSTTKRFRDLYLSGSTIDISGALIKYDTTTDGIKLVNYADNTLIATFKDVITDGNVTVGGNLTVNGDFITLETSTVIVEDPVITLGGSLILNSNDGKDRGIEFKYYDGSSKVGFFGYDNDTGHLVYLLDASNNGEVFSGTFGNIRAHQFIGDTLNVTSSALINNLNADLLDGQQGSYYNDWNNLTNKPNLVNTFNGRVGDISFNATDISTALTYVPLNSATYTASDVLNKLITVDGSGSQLDADLLDGQQGSYYREWNNLTNKPNLVNTFNGRIGDISLNATDISNALTYVPLDATTYTASDVLNKLITVDGSGSQLDADLLDGLDGSYYRNASNINAGVLSVIYGGTGNNALISNRLLVGDGSNPILTPIDLTFINGRLGIGSQLPSEILDVSGNVIISGSLTANNIIGNTSTATQLGTPRKIALQGDVSGNVFFDGSSDVTINSTIQPNSVELGTDTFGNYIATITSGADISVSGSGTESAAVTLSNTSTLQSVTDRGSTTTNHITAAQFVSSTTTLAPFTVNSTSKVTNLNADLLDGLDGSYYLDSSHINTGTLSVSYGGIGTQTLTPNKLLVGDGSNSIISPVELTWNNQLDVSANIQLSGHLLPSSNITSDLGSPDKRFRVLYLSGSTIDLSGALIKYDPITEGIRLSNYANTTVGATFMDVFADGNVTVGGDLTVNGDVITLETSTVIVEDPVITLGGALILNSNDGKDRGIEFRYYDGSSKVGFFGYDNNTGHLVYLLDASNNGEVFSGTYGNIRAHQFIGDTLNVTSSALITNLNADLLDGQHGSYYNDWNNLTNKPNLVNTFNGRVGDVSLNATDISTALTYVPLDASMYTPTDVLNKLITVDGSGSQLDADLLDGQQGSYYNDWNNLFNKPSMVNTFNGRIGDISLNATDISHALTYVPLDATIYTATDVLNKLVTVDGSGSQLDADLLDGQQGNYYNDWNNLFNKPSMVNTFNSRVGDISLNATDIGTALTYVPLDASTYTASDVLNKLITVDGSGSQLDADYLDGLDGSFYRNASNINAGVLSVTYGGIGVNNLSTNKLLVGNGTNGILSPIDLTFVNSNLGIGSLIPSQALDVSGNIHASGNLYVDNIDFSGNLYQNGSLYISSQWISNDTKLYYDVGFVGIGTNDPQESLDVSGNLLLGGHLLPSWNGSYDLGSSNKRFRNLYLSGSTIDLSGALIKYDSTTDGIKLVNYADNTLIARFKDVITDGNVTIGGDLTVNGTFTTLNTESVTVEDPIITLGGYQLLTFNDNKDRGIEFKYYDGSSKVGFFGYDNNTGHLVYLLDASNNGEVFSGTFGNIKANTFIGDTMNITSSALITNLNADLLDGEHGSYYNDWNNLTNKPNLVNTFNSRVGDVSLNATDISTALTYVPLDSNIYTATDVLNKLVTVDGSGSQLDADYLDGQHGSYYNDWNNLTNKPNLVTTFNSRVGDISLNATDISTALTYVPLDATIYTATDVLNKLITVDGSGSQLDADYLDGNDSSFYRDVSNINAGVLNVIYGGIGVNDLSSNKLLLGNGTNGILSPNDLTFVNSRLGIGSLIPTQTLDVSGNILTSGNLYVDNIDFAGNLYQNGSLYTSSQWISNGTKLYYDVGFVGIGTNDPQESLDVSGNLLLGGHLLPSWNVSYDLGSTNQRFRDLYLSGSTIDLSGALIKYDPITQGIRLSNYANTTVGVTFMDVFADGNVTIGGNLTVNGDVITLETSTVIVEDPVITLGGALILNSNDGKDRGIEFKYYDGSSKVGFFGYDNNTGNLVYLLDASSNDEVFTGTYGNIRANSFIGGSITVTSTGLVSNLNADLLDGQQGSYYNNWDNLFNKPNLVNTFNSRVGDISLNATDIGTALTYVPLDASTYTATDVLNKLITVDGSGSQLDADYLDGLDGSFYRNASNINAGVLSVTYGGIGVNNLSTNKLLVGNGTNGILSPIDLSWDSITNLLDISGSVQINGFIQKNGTVKHYKIHYGDIFYNQGNGKYIGYRIQWDMIGSRKKEIRVKGMAHITGMVVGFIRFEVLIDTVDDGAIKPGKFYELECYAKQANNISNLSYSITRYNDKGIELRVLWDNLVTDAHATLQLEVLSPEGNLIFTEIHN